jgi:hypothetical protein
VTTILNQIYEEGASARKKPKARVPAMTATLFLAALDFRFWAKVITAMAACDGLGYQPSLR